MNYSYQNTTIIEFGEGQIKSIACHISKNKKILVVYGAGSIKTNGIYDQVNLALKGYTWFEFSGVEPNPTIETMDKAVKIVKEKNIDFVLAVGGGSVIDGCKYLVAAALYDGDGWDFLDGTKTIEKTLPLGVVLTLPATGSESNNGAVISRKSTNEKRCLYAPTYPKFAVLDPLAMTTLSDRQLTNGIVDAFIHICEQYITYPHGSIVHDGYSETLLKGLVKLANTWDQRREVKWQENLMLIANQALNGFLGAGVPRDWATHMIGHELTAFYGIDHARSLAVVQPQLLRVMEENKREKLKQMGKHVFGIKGGSEDTIVAIENLYNSIDMSTNLNDNKIDDKVISNVTSALKAHGMTSLGEKGDITLKEVSQILTLAMK